MHLKMIPKFSRCMQCDGLGCYHAIFIDNFQLETVALALTRLTDGTFSTQEACKKEGSRLLNKAPGRGVEILVKDSCMERGNARVDCASLSISSDYL